MRTCLIFFILLILGQGALSRGPAGWGIFLGVLLLAVATWILFSHRKTMEMVDLEASFAWWEGWTLAAVFILAAFFRFYRLGDLPFGLFSDQGQEGWIALRVLREGWRPFREIYQWQVPEVLLYYTLAAWFKLWGASLFTFRAYFACVSLVSLLLIYWSFRQLAGPRPAILSVAFLAVMRWDVTLCRNGFPAVQMVFFMFGTMAFFLYALRTEKKWSWALAGFFLGGGFYTYQAYKAFPLVLLAFAAYERIRGRRWNRTAFVIFLLAALGVAAPVFYARYQQGGLGPREAEVWVFRSGNAVLQTLARNTGDIALFLNRSGDTVPRHDVGGKNMLDDFTGAFFAVGLLLALLLHRRREFSFAFAGFALMALPALFSSIGASRMLGSAPFAALMAALALESVGNLWPSTRTRSRFVVGLALAVLAAAGVENGWLYFKVQGDNAECWRSYMPEATDIGRTIIRDGPGARYRLSSRFYLHHTIHFLLYDRLVDLENLELPSGLAAGKDAGRDLCFVLDEGKSGILGFLKALYPGGQENRFKDPFDGHTLVTYYRVPAALTRGLEARAEGLLGNGLKAEYFSSPDWSGKPLAVHRDPVVNLSYANDFAYRSLPMSIHWSGWFRAPMRGSYGWVVLYGVPDEAKLLINKKELIVGEGGRREVFLEAGLHSIDLYYRKTEPFFGGVDLLWRRPGALKYEVVPYDCLGVGPGVSRKVAAR